MTRTIATTLLTLLILLSTAVHAQQPIPRSTPPAIPAQPNGVIMTPSGNITRNGNFVQYPDGSGAVINNGLTTWSNGQGCRTYATTTYCW